MRAIPTGVGNSRWAAATSTSAAGHPHRRGELIMARRLSKSHFGPSPQAWGTRPGMRASSSGLRPSPQAWGTPAFLPRRSSASQAIPTGVGNSLVYAIGGYGRAGHPHRRGELLPYSRSVASLSGPSPQAWGTRHSEIQRSGAERAIPTGVGNSRPPVPESWQSPGHPHRRGELSSTALTVPGSTGPSPQAWGTLCPRRRLRRWWRAIPTGVGNSCRP